MDGNLESFIIGALAFSLVQLNRHSSPGQMVAQIMSQSRGNLRQPNAAIALPRVDAKLATAVAIASTWN